MTDYICPGCGKVLSERIIQSIPPVKVLECSKCWFQMTQSDYDKIMHIGKYGTLDEKDTNPADSQFCKPPLGCKPWYVVYEGRIRELSEAIARYADKPDDHCVYDWLQEIFLLRQFVRLIRKHMKRKEFYDDEIDE